MLERVGVVKLSTYLNVCHMRACLPCARGNIQSANTEKILDETTIGDLPSVVYFQKREECLRNLVVA